jgi:hypothetical protein
MKNIDLIFENNKKWIAEKLAIDANYFENLSTGSILSFYTLVVPTVV